MRVAGLDLAASEKNPSGYYFRKPFLLFSNEEILERVKKDKIKILAIDSPLSLPLKRFYRDCDLEVKKCGIKIFSFKLFSMKLLAKRARNLKRKLNKLKIEVIETYPYAVRKLNKKAEKIFNKTQGSKHEKDAAICKAVALAYSRQKAKFFGKKGKGKIWYF